MKVKRFNVAIMALLGCFGVFCDSNANAQQYQAIVPGTGDLVTEVGDDFEDQNWTYHSNLPKVFNRKDDTLSNNFPLGFSANRRWHEGKMRGQPDSVRRIRTPDGGLAGSQGALAIKTLQAGGPRPSFQQQQEDLIVSITDRIGTVSVAQAPNIVTRVWLPPIDQWENRTGCHFAFRIGLETNPRSIMRGGIRNSEFEGNYWPGMFIHLDSKEGKGGTGKPHDYAHFWIKATDDGREMKGPQITTTGWWTLGISLTPDGRVHYFAKPGVEDLTEKDLIGSSYPFGYRAKRLRSCFFNICNGDDGRTWSTEFVIDDTQLFMTNRRSIGTRQNQPTQYRFAR